MCAAAARRERVLSVDETPSASVRSHTPPTRVETRESLREHERPGPGGRLCPEAQTRRGRRRACGRRPPRRGGRLGWRAGQRAAVRSTVRRRDTVLLPRRRPGWPRYINQSLRRVSTDTDTGTRVTRRLVTAAHARARHCRQHTTTLDTAHIRLRNSIPLRTKAAQRRRK